MKIDNSVKSAATAVGGVSPARQRADTPSVSGSSTAPSTQVQLSSLSTRLDNVLANAPVTNPSRIAEIKQAIAEGRFTVNAEKIADGLIDSVRQLLDKRGSNA